jgi:hypothetical protein
MLKKNSKWFKICLLFFTILTRPPISYAQYKLSVVKNFKIESLYPVEIVDYSSKDALYLGYINSTEGKRIVIIDERGDLISNKILEGDGPNKSSTPFNAMSFAEDGTIYIQSYSFIYRYDKNFNLIEKFSYPSTTSIRIYGRMEFFPYFHLLGSNSSFSFITNPSDTNSFRPGNDTESKLIEIFQKGTKEPFKIAQVSDRAMFSKFDQSLIADLYFIIYKLDPKSRKLYLTTRIDNEIIIYDLISKKLESRIKINHEEFKILQKSKISRNDFITNGRIALGAKNHKLFSLGGGKIVLDYIQEIPYGIYEKKITDDPTYHHYQDPNYHRLIVFEGTKQVSGDIKLPENGKLMTSLPDNRLLFQLINPNMEEDFVRFGLYELVKSGN